MISIGVSGLILAACVWYWFKTKHGIDGNGEAAGSKPLSMAKRMSIGRLTLVCWMVLALLSFRACLRRSYLARMWREAIS